MSYFQIIWLTFSFALFGGFCPMVDEEQAPSIDEKNAFKRTFDQSFHPFFPNPGIDWIFWTPAWHFDFTSHYIRLSPPDCLSPWSSWSIIILSFIMPNVAQWSLIVISRSNQPIDAPLQLRTCFPDKIYPRWLICWFLCSRETMFSVHTKNIWLATFGPIEISQSNVS